MAATAGVVDLTNVGEGGKFKPRRKPEGDYRAKIVKADDHQPNDKTKPKGWVLTIQVEGDLRSTYPYYLSPDEKQLWKIRGICLAAGLNVGAKRIRFDPNKLVGKSIGVALADDEYEGRLKSSIDDVFPVSEVGANADEDAPEDDEGIDLDDEDYQEEEPEPDPAPPVRKRRAKVEPEPEPEEDEDEEEEEEEEEPAPPPRRRKRAPAPDPEPEEDEEEEEEAPAPAPRRRRAAPPPAKAATRRKPAPPADDEDDDLDDLDTDDL